MNYNIIKKVKAQKFYNNKLEEITETVIDDIYFNIYINEKKKKKGDYSLMINKPLEIIEEANSFLSFEDGDILMSGTPKGVGEFKINDVFIGKIIYDNKTIIEETFIVS